MTPALRAHVRLLETWPREKIRTHYSKPREKLCGSVQGRTPEQMQALYEKVRELRVVRGLPFKAIAYELRIGQQTARDVFLTGNAKRLRR